MGEVDECSRGVSSEGVVGGGGTVQLSWGGEWCW